MPTCHAPVPSEKAADQPAADAQYYRRVLHELIDMGADLARMVHQQARGKTKPPADVTVAFDRISRAVRRTIMLARKLDEPLPVAPTQHRAAARRRIIRGVEDTIQRQAGGSKAEALHGEFLDRLDGPDLEDDLTHRPVADIIADICRDLGLAAQPGTHPWKRRTPEDVLILCARAAACPIDPAASPPPDVPRGFTAPTRDPHPPRPPPPA